MTQRRRVRKTSHHRPHDSERSFALVGDRIPRPVRGPVSECERLFGNPCGDANCCD